MVVPNSVLVIFKVIKTLSGTTIWSWRCWTSH